MNDPLCHAPQAASAALYCTRDSQECSPAAPCRCCAAPVADEPVADEPAAAPRAVFAADEGFSGETTG